MKLKSVIILLWFLISGYTAKAQTKTDSTKTLQLNEVVITGTRTERDPASLPISTQLVSGDNIRQSGVSRLNEIIREQTGLITKPSFGGGEGIQMQGLDAAYTLILMDGQPLMGRSSGILDLSRISVNNVERIEIVKGASSCLYGSEALAGVVNIITKNPAVNDKLKLEANYKIASFNTHDISINSYGGKNKIGGELFANYYSSDGYNLTESTILKTVEPYKNFTVQPRVKVNFSDRLNLVAGLRFYRQDQDNKMAISNQIYFGKSLINEWNGTALALHRVSEKVKLAYDLYATHYKADEYLNDKNNQLFDERRYNQWFYRPEIRSHIKWGKHTLTTGIGMNYETLERTLFNKKFKLNSDYVFVQQEWFIKEKWNILSGFRYDHHHQYPSQFSPKIGALYNVAQSFSLRASVGYGYKAPDARQVYLDFTNAAVGYTVLGYTVAADRLAELQEQGQILKLYEVRFMGALKPESSINFNLGGSYHRKLVFGDFNFFYNAISNLIDTRAVALKTNGQNVFSYFNINQIFTYGLEISATYKILTNLSLSAGYQFLVAKDKEVAARVKKGEVFARDPITLSSFQLTPSDYTGLYNRSPHIANFKVNYRIPSMKIALQARLFYNDKYGVFDSNGNAILDKYDTFVKGYFLTNISAVKEFKYGISLQIGSVNLLDYTDKVYLSNLSGRQLFTRVLYTFKK